MEGGGVNNRAAAHFPQKSRRPADVLSRRSDSGTFQELSLTERFKLELRFEGYNLTNSVMPGNPNLTVTSTQFGGITSQVNYGREVQYTLRLHF